jgi:RsiW-degrading membrane proteinase PrsW (M82 family)
MDYSGLLLSIFLAGIPILLWGYVFAYFDGLEFRRSEFGMGIIAGGLGVIPIAYSAEIARFFQTSSFINQLGTLPLGLDAAFLYGVGFFVPITLLLVLLLILSPRSMIAIIRPIFWIIGGAGVLIGTLALLVSQIPPFWGGDLTLQGTMIMSFSGVVIAYIFIASVEEGLKHVSSYVSITPWITTAKQILLVAIYSALWFVFIENILYLSGIAGTSGVGSNLYYGTLFSRSIVSLLLHVFASLILALGFIKYLSKMTLRSWISLGLSFLIATFVHAAFNIALTYEKAWIIGLYGIVLYFFMTKIFLDERVSREA